MENKHSQIFWSIWNIVEAFLLIAAGIMCILFRNNSELKGCIGYIIGAFVILDGALRVVLFFSGFKKSEEGEALVGGFEAALGAVICLQHQNFISILIQFLYCLLIAIGGLILAMAILRIIKHKSTLFMPILTIIFGAILCGLGLAILIIYEFTSDESEILIMILMGTILSLVGGTQCIITFIQTIKASRRKNSVVPVDTPKAPEYGKAKEVDNKKQLNEQNVIEVDTK